MNTTEETAASTTAAPRYELLQTFAWAQGGGNSHRSTFDGSAEDARKERIARLKAQGRAFIRDGKSVIYAERNGDQVRLEWVQK